MSGVAIVRALLVADGPLIAQVPAARIQGGDLDIGTELPAISVQAISGTPERAISRPASGLRSERVQVSIIAPDYPAQKALLDLVRAAGHAGRGTIASCSVDSVLIDSEGPDLHLTDPTMYVQTIDLMVRYSV